MIEMNHCFEYRRNVPKLLYVGCLRTSEIVRRGVILENLKISEVEQMLMLSSNRSEVTSVGLKHFNG